MSVKQINIAGKSSPKAYTGLTTDTEAWLAANKKEVDGSTYRELDGDYRLYEFQSGDWYPQA